MTSITIYQSNLFTVREHDYKEPIGIAYSISNGIHCCVVTEKPELNDNDLQLIWNDYMSELVSGCMEEKEEIEMEWTAINDLSFKR